MTDDLHLLAAEAAAKEAAKSGSGGKVPHDPRSHLPPGRAAATQAERNYFSKSMFTACAAVAASFTVKRPEGVAWDQKLNDEAFAIYRMVLAGWGSAASFEKLLFDHIYLRRPQFKANDATFEAEAMATLGRAWAGALRKGPRDPLPLRGQAT